MLSDLYIRLRSLFRTAKVEQELDEELRFHRQQQADKYMRTGMSREEALRQARLDFGGLEQVKEDCREARGVSLLDSLAQDLRYGTSRWRGVAFLDEKGVVGQFQEMKPSGDTRTPFN